jgi:hypothetical protein
MVLGLSAYIALSFYDVESNKLVNPGSGEER